MIDRRIKYRHLICFLEVARQRSIIQAADILAITQPAISKTIRELEETLDVRLFDRSKKGVTLTSFGEVFMRYAGASVTALRQGVDSIAQARSRGELSITAGILPTVAVRIMPQAVRRFKEDSDATVKLITGPNTLLLGRLRVGELDLVVGRLAEPDQMAGLSFTHLYSEHISIVVRLGHPLTRDKPFDLMRIREFTVLYPTADSIIRPFVDAFMIAQGVGHVPDRIETISNAFGREYIRQTDAIWIISNGVVAPDIEDGVMVELPIDTTDTMGPVGLTTRADTPPSPAMQMFMNAVTDAASSLGPLH